MSCIFFRRIQNITCKARNPLKHNITPRVCNGTNISLSLNSSKLCKRYVPQNTYQNRTCIKVIKEH